MSVSQSRAQTSINRARRVKKSCGGVDVAFRLAINDDDDGSVDVSSFFRLTSGVSLANNWWRLLEPTQCFV